MAGAIVSVVLILAFAAMVWWLLGGDDYLNKRSADKVRIAELQAQAARDERLKAEEAGRSR